MKEENQFQTRALPKSTVVELAGANPEADKADI
jgi:hypothetical protein